jgi:hypothetical protein
MTILLAARPIDFAIFGTLGALWFGGAVFIVLLFRWIARFERARAEEDAMPPTEQPGGPTCSQ